MPSREQGHGQVLGKFLSLFYCDKGVSSDKGGQNVYLDPVLGFVSQAHTQGADLHPVMMT